MALAFRHFNPILRTPRHSRQGFWTVLGYGASGFTSAVSGLRSTASEKFSDCSHFQSGFSSCFSSVASVDNPAQHNEEPKHREVTTNIKAPHNENVVWSDALLTKAEREAYLDSKNVGATLYLTGLSGSGKSTVGAALEHKLLTMGIHAYRLDGDNIRFGLNKGLGFSAEDREENLRRIGEVSALFADCGVVAITSFISPYRSSRRAARDIHSRNSLPFYEVFTDVPLSVAESRDPKGLYKKARAGELKGFTGIDDPYEPPENPDLVLETHQHSVEDCVNKIIKLLREQKIIRE